MSISPLYKCPHCKEEAFVVCGSNETMKIGACLACNKSGHLPNKARTRLPVGGGNLPAKKNYRKVSLPAKSG